MNEWGFAAEVKSWWDAAMASDEKLGLDRCEVEEQVEVGSSLRRSDLTVKRGQAVVLAGELRLPDHPQSDPWDPDSLQGAISKAQSLGARWAFTSDANTLLMIDTQLIGPVQDRVRTQFTVGNLANRADLGSASVLAAARASWIEALSSVAALVNNKAEPVPLSPDARFIQSLRGLLHRPVRAIADALDQRRTADQAFAANLIRWMVDEQSWVHSAEQWQAEIRRTAHLTAYVFTTRLLFYEALRRGAPTLAPLTITQGAPASVARATVQGYFAHAREVSHDYETLFTWDRACDYALVADEVVAGWTRVIDRLAAFDLASIDYDVLGHIFERLIDPHERYRFGQHYTSSAVVDLMLSYGIPDGQGAVADFAAGGGTFLVRAYARKQALRPEITHQELLTELHGTDISAFAASLSTVNLAVRDLALAANYPRVSAQSFFRLRPGQPYMEIPDGSGSMQDVVVPPLQAVALNPPYIRVQNLSDEQRAEADGILGDKSSRPPTPAKINRNSNYHLYFWLHAGRFLRDDGRLAFITSGEWLDSDYGATLQLWLLDHFRVEALVESMAEPWFSEARVGTVVVLAQRCVDPALRAANIVRFVTLRRPLATLYGCASDAVDHFAKVDALRERILSLGGSAGESDDLDHKTISQRALRDLGDAP